MARDPQEIDRTRRNFGSWLGALGGATLAGCLPAANASSEKASTAAEGLTGPTVGWVDTIGTATSPGELRGLVGDAFLQAVVAAGFWALGDGGGGVFRWDPASTAPDDGGTVINPTNNKGSGRWRRIYSGSLHVNWFGAIGDGVDRSADGTYDTGFLQAAINAARIQNLPQLADSETVGSTQAVDFGHGMYLLTSALQVADQRLNLVSDSGALLQQLTSTAAIVSFPDVYENVVRGLRFVGGANHITMQNENLDATVVTIRDCEFQMSSGYAIVASPTAPADHMSAQLTIDNCKFYSCGGVLQSVCDLDVVQNTWVETPARLAAGAPPAVFANLSGSLFLRNMEGIPVFAEDANDLPVRWVDNYGNLYAEHSRFGGDNGSGIPMVFHYAPLPSAFPFNEGYSIVIRDSAVFCGLRNQTQGNPFAAIITIVGPASCPQRVILEGVTGPSDANEPIIQAYPGYNLANYITANPNAAYYIKISVDSNIVESLAGVYSALLPYVNPFESSVFPMGARAGLPVPGVPSQSYATFNLPANASGFVGILTLSVNPNNAGSNSYRTTASYLVSVSTNYDYVPPAGVKDFICWAPLFQPATNGLYPLPSIVAMSFDARPATTTSPASRPTTTGGTLNVIWDSNWTGALVEYSTVSIQPIHMIG